MFLFFDPQSCLLLKGSVTSFPSVISRHKKGEKLSWIIQNSTYLCVKSTPGAWGPQWPLKGKQLLFWDTLYMSPNHWIWGFGAYSILGNPRINRVRFYEIFIKKPDYVKDTFLDTWHVPRTPWGYHVIGRAVNDLSFSIFSKDIDFCVFSGVL